MFQLGVSRLVVESSISGLALQGLSRVSWLMFQGFLTGSVSRNSAVSIMVRLWIDS